MVGRMSEALEAGWGLGGRRYVIVGESRAPIRCVCVTSALISDLGNLSIVFDESLIGVNSRSLSNLKELVASCSIFTQV